MRQCGAERGSSLTTPRSEDEARAQRWAIDQPIDVCRFLLVSRVDLASNGPAPPPKVE
jgi:hypothetical protein